MSSNNGFRIPFTKAVLRTVFMFVPPTASRTGPRVRLVWFGVPEGSSKLAIPFTSTRTLEFLERLKGERNEFWIVHDEFRGMEGSVTFCLVVRTSPMLSCTKIRSP